MVPASDRKIVAACFLGGVSILLLMVPLLNLPLAIVAAPLFLLPWSHADIVYGPGMMAVESTRAQLVFFVYFSAFWALVDWLRAKSKAIKIAQDQTTDGGTSANAPNLLRLLIVSFLPVLLIWLLLIPGFGCVGLAVALGVASVACYRGMRAFQTPWKAIFIALAGTYAVGLLGTVALAIIDMLRQ